MSYEYTVSIPAGKRAQFRALVKQLGGRVVPGPVRRSDEPNEETLRAMREVEAGIGLEPFDLKEFSAFVATL